MIAVQKTTACIECLLAAPENENLRDFQNNRLCADCAERYYAACAVCSLFVAKDEAFVIESAGSEIQFRCLNCPAETQSELSFAADAETVAVLVEEYLRLHVEEKNVKERLETVKEKLKQIADAQSTNGSSVTLESPEGAVKCSYRTTLKVVPESVFALREQLDVSVFNRLFAEKISFDLTKDFEKVLADDLPAEIKQQIEAAVKRGESSTLNVLKK